MAAVSSAEVPLVSIIMPAFNAEAVIGETIESVQAQTYPHWELLITDDGSTDGTMEVVRSYRRKDRRIRLFCFPKNTGLAAKARNYSMKRSRGELLAFLDADDLWKPEKLEKQVQYLQEHPEADAVCCWWTVFGDPEQVRLWKKMLWRDDSRVLDRNQILNTTPATSSVMIRHKCYEEVGEMEASKRLCIAEDRQYFIRIVLTHAMHRILEELVLYRVNPTGGSLSTAKLTLRKQYQKEMIKSLKRRGVIAGKLEKQFWAQFYYDQAKDSLFHFNRPFRGDLARSILTFHPPLKAVVMFALCWLPAPALRKVLIKLLELRNPKGG